MLPLTHLGIGSAVVAPLTRKLPFGWLLLGTLLPDLIDKPVYFAMGLYARYTTGDWVPGKRGFAHTLLFLLLLALLSWAKRSKPWTSVSVGVSSHLVLDILSKAFGPVSLQGVGQVLLWPFLGVSFPVLSYGVHGPTAIAFELAGAVLLTAQLGLRRRRARIQPVR